MAATARNAPPPIPVARVLKQGSYFVCGICRKPHTRKEEGNACVNKCFTALTSGSLVVHTRQWGRDVFRCKLCTRTYAQVEPCQACANECLTRMQGKLPPMPRLLPNGTYAPQADTPSAPRKPITRAPAPTPAPRMAPPKIVARPAAPAPVAAPPPVAAAPELEPTPPPPTAEAEAPKAPKKPRDRTKKFHREGAKYVCQECSSKYFTKVEVEACFDKHE